MSSKRKLERSSLCTCGSGKKRALCSCRDAKPASARPKDDLLGSKQGREGLPSPKFGSFVWDLAREDETLRANLERIETIGAKFSALYCVPSRIPDPSLRNWLDATLTQHLMAESDAIQVAYGRRLATMYCDAIDSIGRRRLHLASLALRAFLELTGAATYFDQRLRSLLGAGVPTQEQLDQLNEVIRIALDGGRFDWLPFFAGGAQFDRLLAQYANAKNHDKEPTQEVRQKSPGTFVAELEKRFTLQFPGEGGKVRALYAALSDICHPSVGGDLFFDEIPAIRGVIASRAEPHDAMTREFIMRLASPVLIDVSQTTVWALNQLGALANWLGERDSTGRS